MNKPSEIKEAVNFIEDYFKSSHTMMDKEVFEKNLLDKVSLDVLLQLGMRLVKQPARTFLEYPDKEITESRIDTVILLYGEKE